MTRFCGNLLLKNGAKGSKTLVFLDGERITVDAPTKGPPYQASLRMVPPITLSSKLGQTETTEIFNTPDGPWSEWRTVVIGEQGTPEVDLDEGAEKRFYRVRD